MTVECHVILLGRFKGWLNVLTINPASVLQLCWVLYSLRPFCICDWYLVLEGVVKVVLTHLPHSHVLFSTQPFFFLNDLYMISVLTIWSCPCVEASLVLLEEGFCYNQCVLLANSISISPDSFHIPRLNLPVTPGVSWLLLLHSSPL